VPRSHVKPTTYVMFVKRLLKLLSLIIVVAFSNNKQGCVLNYMTKC
jgi:hypothetical protein